MQGEYRRSTAGVSDKKKGRTVGSAPSHPSLIAEDYIPSAMAGSCEKL